jgi:hypothetical protein
MCMYPSAENQSSYTLHGENEQCEKCLFHKLVALFHCSKAKVRTKSLAQTFIFTAILNKLHCGGRNSSFTIFTYIIVCVS